MKYVNLKSLFTGIADEIRAKTGSTESIVADDFPAAIATIETRDDEDKIINGWLDHYVNNRVIYIRPHAFAGCTYLQFIELRNIREIGTRAFYGCQGLRNVIVNSVMTIFAEAFADCNQLEHLVCPSLTSLVNYALSGSSIRMLDMYGGKDGSLADYSCGNPSLETLIIRGIDGIPSLGNKAFIDKNDVLVNLIEQARGYIYVPRALLEDYKVAENWRNYASQFRAIEDYSIDGTVTGKLLV